MSTFGDKEGVPRLLEDASPPTGTGEPPLYAITTSKGYGDTLDITLPANARFFRRWYVIVDKADSEDLHAVERWRTNLKNIECVRYDFTDGGQAPFDKYGAILQVQERIGAPGAEYRVVLLDADILIRGPIPTTRDASYLYHPRYRNDYSSLADLRNHKPRTRYERTISRYDPSWCQGFFQMYHVRGGRNPHYVTVAADIKQRDASLGDLLFKQSFASCKLIDLTVAHLGMSGVHWKGRKSHNDFT